MSFDSVTEYEFNFIDVILVQKFERERESEKLILYID